ncbi:MAG: UDP-N-acetylmuramoyl-L-alanine--D-glutamate ligase [Luteolibacter sp.]
MSNPSTIADSHLAILGAGRSGKAAAALAVRLGARVSVFDTAGPEAFAGMPEQATCQPLADEASAVACDILVVSPGIDPTSSLVRAFSARAGETIGEVELAAREYSGTIIGITGTNGKTTTTELVGRMLAQAGLGGTPCGNYGMPFAEVVAQSEHPAAVALELSSFQLETITTLRPRVAIWLNFAPDHLDRYPDVETYHAAKLRIFDYQTAEDTAVVRHGEPWQVHQAAIISQTPPTRARTVTFSTTEPTADWYSDGSTIRHQGKSIVDLAEFHGLRSLHNVENAMAAMAACHAIGIPIATMIDALHGFAPPPHRCEMVRTLDGVEYLNDSKATNLHALESALRSQPRPVVLIAGGKEKGLDYSQVLPTLKEKAVAAVTFGQIAAPLGKLFSSVVPTQTVNDLAAALAAARALAPRGSTVLFSPGTSSFDQFKSYEHRGDTFRDLVHQLR